MGQGTIFRFLLPVKGARRRMNRILILDDDRAVLNCFETLLAQTGRYETEVLADSTRAVETGSPPAAST